MYTDAPRLSEEDLNEVYSWVDSIPLSRPKKNIARDFSDGVLIAEIIAAHIPRLVELHNYSAANSAKQKQYNWDTLNKKVFRKIGFQVSQQDQIDIIECKPEVIERILKIVKEHIINFSNNQQQYQMNQTSKQAFSVQEQQQQQFNLTGGVAQRGQLQSRQLQQGQQQDEIIWEKEQVIGELKETIEIMELKIKKLEDLLTLKDNKIKAMQDKMSQHGLY